MTEDEQVFNASCLIGGIIGAGLLIIIAKMMGV